MLALAFSRDSAHRAGRAGAFAVLFGALAVAVAPLSAGAQPNPAASYSRVRPPPPQAALAEVQRPPPSLRMPDVRGRSLEDAQLMLRQLARRLPPTVSSTPSGRPRGTVVAQSPQPNAVISPEMRISLVVSSGPPIVVQLPPFSPPQSSTPKPPPQRPPAERPPPERPPPQRPPEPKPDLVTVPPLVGLTAVEARDRLGLERLLLGRATEQPSANSGCGILSSTPAGGAPVPPGTSVDYAQTSGRNLVPSVIGLTEAAAAARLSAAGFERAVNAVKPGVKRLDAVAAQSP